MDFISKCTLFIFFVTVVSFVAVEANYEENLPEKNENTLKTTKSYVGDLSISAEEGKSRVKRQIGGYYEPYYNRRRRPYPPIIFGGIGGFGGYGFGRGYGGRGFGGRGFGGRGFGGRGIGGRGIGGRGIGGRGGIGGFGGGRGGGRG